VERIEDHVIFEDQKAFAEHLKRRTEKFEDLADQIRNRTELEDASRVFPNVLRCIARQLRILGASSSLPIEAAAAACRTVFEVYVRTKLMTEKPELIRSFWVERVFEEISLLDAFKRLADNETQASALAPINSRVEEIKNYIKKWNLAKPTTESTFKFAEAAGMSEEYKALYGFYSKYTHGSAWLVNTQDSERDGEGYRTIFSVQTQLYAEATLESIQRYVAERSKTASPDARS
jgi:hypothetical protein